MGSLTPVLAVVIIGVSALALLVALPRPHDVTAHLKDFTGMKPKASSTDATAPELETEKVEAKPNWGNLDFSIFGDGVKSPDS
jgi:hypothetical protein